MVGSLSKQIFFSQNNLFQYLWWFSNSEIMFSSTQELIFRLEEFRPYGWYLTLVQFGCYIGFGLVEMMFSADNKRK